MVVQFSDFIVRNLVIVQQVVLVELGPICAFGWRADEHEPISKLVACLLDFPHALDLFDLADITDDLLFGQLRYEAEVIELAG